MSAFAVYLDLALLQELRHTEVVTDASLETLLHILM